MSTTSMYLRVRHGKGFFYTDGRGERLTSRDEIAYIKSLAIPPAWQNVQISPRRGAKILATGIDAAGRKQYIYHPGFRERRDKAKFDRLLAFAEGLPHMRRVTGQHMRQRILTRQKVLACMVRLMDEAYFRVGNESYAKNNHSYGLSTLRSKHLQIENDRLVFDYIGKSQQHQRKVVKDAKLAQIVRELDDMPGYEVFRYYDTDGTIRDIHSSDVNAYIKEVMGDEFSAKDFRTWGGTLIAAVALDTTEVDKAKGPLKKHVTQAIESVAARLGNTPSIAKASYIDPRVIDHFLNGTTIQIYLDQLGEATTGGLTRHEAALIQLLRRRLIRSR